MHAFLITGGSEEERKNALETMLREKHIGQFDVHPLQFSSEGGSLGIKAVKSWQQKLLLRPVASPMKAGIIEQANFLTTEAQNALLKTLEEPPPNTILILTANTSSYFLPTILSRCLITHIQPQNKKDTESDQKIIETLQKLLPPATRAAIIQGIDSAIQSRDEAKQWVNTALQVVHDHPEVVPHTVRAPLLGNLLTALDELSVNVSYKLVLDTVFFSLRD